MTFVFNAMCQFFIWWAIFKKVEKFCLSSIQITSYTTLIWNEIKTAQELLMEITQYQM